LPVLDREGNAHYHVEAIVDAKTIRGTPHLRVKWLGYPSSANTWEPRATLVADCPDAVREWDSQQA
jgi:hypothetical protein